MCAPAAHADQPLWELGLGVGALELPHYRGSDQKRLWLLPIPYFNYRGEFFRADREGGHVVLVDTERFDFDVSLAANTPTRSRSNRAREGMPDLAPTLEIGPSAKVLLGNGAGWKLDLQLPARAVFSVDSKPRNVGWTFSPILNLALDVHNWNVTFQAGPVAANRRYHAYYYDVAPQFATPTRVAYNARGGFGGYALTTLASRRIDNFWIGSYIQFDSLAGSVIEDSPLVKKRQNVAFGVGVSYIFAESSARAPERRSGAR